jgi:two-component system sensor histidine kinase/response regulator
VRPRILIVDDNPTNLRLATDILEDAGCQIYQAGDAEEAVAMLQSITPDLILMDIALPGMDGLSLTRQLKGDARFRQIPVVALTASAMKGDQEKALAAGCQAYITKPIDTRRFGQQILGYVSAEDARAPSGKVILVVDDYPANRELLRAGLEGEGLTVVEAGNGVEALRLLDQQQVDAVISDILMPAMDGFRLCHEIRKGNQSYASIPFILYTATYNSPSDRDLARTVGADDYIVKPAPIAVIMEALRRTRLQTENIIRPAVQRPADSYVLEQYSAALVRKLEERNADLQRALARISDLNQHLEDRVAQRTAQLSAANQSLDAFSYSVAHDLRGPLSHISLSAELLKELAGTRLDQRCQEYLDTIVQASQRMAALIGDLLEFSRSGRVDMHIARVELDELLRDALAAVQPDVQGRNVEWICAPLPVVQGDPAMLRQVFINLLSNALKYSRTRDRARIEIGQGPDEAACVVVFVRDNGVGFDMAQAGELFKVFRRLHSGSEFEGTGVGLASSFQTVSRHGGRMWAEAAVGCGATFYVALPAT